MSIITPTSLNSLSKKNIKSFSMNSPHVKVFDVNYLEPKLLLQNKKIKLILKKDIMIFDLLNSANEKKKMLIDKKRLKKKDILPSLNIEKNYKSESTQCELTNRNIVRNIKFTNHFLAKSVKNKSDNSKFDNFRGSKHLKLDQYNFYKSRWTTYNNLNTEVKETLNKQTTVPSRNTDLKNQIKLNFYTSGHAAVKLTSCNKETNSTHMLQITSVNDLVLQNVNPIEVSHKKKISN